VLWVQDYKRKYRPENIEPKPSTDVLPIRKNSIPTVNNQGKVRKHQAHLERNTQNPKPIDPPPLAQ